MLGKHGCLPGLCKPDGSCGDDLSQRCDGSRMCLHGVSPHQEMQEIIDGMLKTYGEGRQKCLPR